MKPIPVAAAQIKQNFEKRIEAPYTKEDVEGCTADIEFDGPNHEDGFTVPKKGTDSSKSAKES